MMKNDRNFNIENDMTTEIYFFTPARIEVVWMTQPLFLVQWRSSVTKSGGAQIFFPKSEKPKTRRVRVYTKV